MLGNCGIRATSRDVPQTSWPRAASNFAVARQMPALAPGMNTRFISWVLTRSRKFRPAVIEPGSAVNEKKRAAGDELARDAADHHAANKSRHRCQESGDQRMANVSPRISP